ncbi:MAG: hypothetical protein ACFFG0_47375 [Candidatus Thorarchaeota archaeon]
MKQKTFDKLKEAEEICSGESLEYMIQFMQDYAKVDHDCVMKYLYLTRDK